MLDTLFISDLHLDEAQPAITDGLLAFLEREAPTTHSLYVHGDLFEKWIGDDLDTPLVARVATAFRAFSDAGRALYLMHGNRDFLIGKAFTDRCGATLLAEPALLSLAGEKVLLMHGDSLCTDDVEYQKFRAMVRDPRWQADVLGRPLAERLALAAKIRGESKSQNAAKAEYIMDVNADAVAAALRESGATVLLHGHTHRPAAHGVDLGDRRARRLVNGDWQAHQGWCIRANAHGLHLESFPLPLAAAGTQAAP